VQWLGGRPTAPLVASECVFYGPADEAATPAQSYVAQGFRLLKIRVGMEPFSQDVSRVGRIRCEYVALGPFVAVGHNSTIMHGNWRRNPIARGQSIILEIGVSVQRYNAALMRTVSIGPPPGRLRDMAQASEEANRAAYEAIKPGVTSGEVHETCQRVFERAGLLDLRCANRTGYSIGLAFPPDWGEGHILSLQEKDSTVLQPGMVFHIPSAVREYGTFGAFSSETVLVTPTGHERLTEFEQTLFVRE
jgi:Xaa-Pro dipeptidase